jgi:hypothetical protein
MQIAYRGRNAEDARGAREVLAAAGITAFVPDPEPTATRAGGTLAEVRVLVDNRLLDRARRALVPWIGERKRDQRTDPD